MAKISTLWLCAVLLSIVIAGIQCQDDGESGSDGGGGTVRRWWTTFREKWRDLTQTLRELVRELAQEVTSRTTDFRTWTKEMFEGFRAEMRKLLEGNLPQEDRREVENILQKMQKYENEAQRR